MTTCPDCIEKDTAILRLTAKNASLQDELEVLTRAIRDVCVSNTNLREALAEIQGEPNG